MWLEFFTDPIRAGRYKRDRRACALNHTCTLCLIYDKQSMFSLIYIYTSASINLIIVRYISLIWSFKIVLFCFYFCKICNKKITHVSQRRNINVQCLKFMVFSSLKEKHTWQCIYLKSNTYEINNINQGPISLKEILIQNLQCKLGLSYNLEVSAEDLSRLFLSNRLIVNLT